MKTTKKIIDKTSQHWSPAENRCFSNQAQTLFIFNCRTEDYWLKASSITFMCCHILIPHGIKSYIISGGWPVLLKDAET